MTLDLRPMLRGEVHSIPLDFTLDPAPPSNVTSTDSAHITGLITGALGKSNKTENGYLESHAALKGLLKKSLIILVVLLAALLDQAVSAGAGIQFEAVMGATCLWFIASEGLSILENVALMGVPVPKILLKLLEVMRAKGDVQEAAKPEKPEEKPEE